MPTRSTPRIPTRSATDKLERPELGKMTAAQAAAFDAAAAEPPARIPLSADEKVAVGDAVATANALMLNALLHRFDPVAYPVSESASALEKAAIKHVAGLAPKTFNRLLPGISRVLGDARSRRRYLRHLSDIELNKADVSRRITKALKGKQVNLRVATIPRGETIARAAAGTLNWTQLHLQVRAIHCVDETDPEGGSDDMVLGGAMIGASGNVASAKSFVAGEFDDGTRISYGLKLFGVFNLNAKKDYPKTYYAVFQLVESDSDDKEVAEGLTKTVSFIASAVVGALATPAVGAVVAAVVDAIGSFIGMFISDDHFPPWSAWVRQDGPTRFKTNGGVTWDGPESPDLRTEDIVGHGGRYRIGYRWAMA